MSYGIPQGSVLGPTLFSMFTNNLPMSVVSGLVYMFADDTTIYCVGTSADKATAQLNLAMHELYSWCLSNKLTLHPGKSVIFPSMNYGLILWGACCNSNNLDFLERLHCRVARIIFNLLKDMASHGVLEHAEYSLFIFIIN